jgi:hypothetical protein
MDVLAGASHKECFWVQFGNYSNSIIEIRTIWSKGREYKIIIAQLAVTCYILIKVYVMKCKLQKILRIFCALTI